MTGPMIDWRDIRRTCQRRQARRNNLTTALAVLVVVIIANLLVYLYWQAF